MGGRGEGRGVWGGLRWGGTRGGQKVRYGSVCQVRYAESDVCATVQALPCCPGRRVRVELEVVS